jgi:hypothetical protein
MAGGLTAVHGQDLAGHERGVLKLENALDDFVNLAHSPQWVQPCKGRIRLRRVHRGLDDSQGHRVGADAAAGLLDGQRLGGRVQPPLVIDASTAGTPLIGWFTRVSIRPNVSTPAAIARSATRASEMSPATARVSGTSPGRIERELATTR